MRRLYDNHHVNASRVQARWAGVYRAPRPSSTDRSIIANIRREDLGKSMRYDDNHKERTRARVLAEAAAAIRSKGVERVGVAEVMAGAGLTHGGFYPHFKSKDDLLTQAISYKFDDAYASFLRHTEGRAPADALSNYIDAYLPTSHRDDRAHSCPLPALSGDLPHMPAVARARFADGTERLVAAFAKLVKKLGAKHAEALAWSALVEMAGRRAPRRTDLPPAQSA